MYKLGRFIPPYSNNPNMMEWAVCLFQCISGKTAVKAGDCIVLQCFSVRVRAGKGKRTLGKK